MYTSCSSRAGSRHSQLMFQTFNTFNINWWTTELQLTVSGKMKKYVKNWWIFFTFEVGFPKLHFPHFVLVYVLFSVSYAHAAFRSNFDVIWSYQMILHIFWLNKKTIWWDKILIIFVSFSYLYMYHQEIWITL